MTLTRILTLVLGLAVATAAAMAQSQAQAETFRGTLIDNACFKADMSQDALAKHTRDCALMDGCMESGYAVVTADGHVYKLDPAGNEKTIEALKASEQAGNLKVTVTGTNTDGTITVASIVLDK